MPQQPDDSLKKSTDFDDLPLSCTSMIVNFSGVLGLVFAIIVLREMQVKTLWISTLVCISSIIIPIAGLEFILRKLHPRLSSDIDFTSWQPVDFRRAGTKILGFLGTLALIGFIYWILPEYHGGFYADYWELLRHGLPILVVASIFYILLIDAQMENPYDGYWHAGMFSAVNGARLIFQLSSNTRLAGSSKPIFFL